MSHAVLFVCLGNICRSPLAEGVFRAIVDEAGLAERFAIDSAGTGAWHVGNPPDPRSIEIAAKHGIDISGQRARQVEARDFERFDTILALDHNNLSSMKPMARHGTATVRLLLNAPAQDVPDPYYGGPDGFEAVYQLVRAGGQKLLDDLT